MQRSLVENLTGDSLPFPVLDSLRFPETKPPKPYPGYILGKQ